MKQQYTGEYKQAVKNTISQASIDGKSFIESLEIAAVKDFGKLDENLQIELKQAWIYPETKEVENQKRESVKGCFLSRFDNYSQMLEWVRVQPFVVECVKMEVLTDNSIKLYWR